MADPLGVGGGVSGIHLRRAKRIKIRQIGVESYLRYLVIPVKTHGCPGKNRSIRMACSNVVVKLKLSSKFNAPESVVPAKAGTQCL
jgi:hypothetical protein